MSRRDAPPLLTPAEEQELARTITAAREARDRVGPPTRAEAGLLAAADAAVATLVERNLRLAWSIARYHEPKYPRVDVEVLEGYARAGLFHAARRYEPRGVKFSTFAAWYGALEIRRNARDGAGAIRIPASPDPELAARAWSAASLDAPSEPDEPGTLGGRLADPLSLDDPDEVGAAVAAADALAALGRLPGRLGLVARRRYVEGRTLADIGRELGVTRERVRQLERDALAELRRILGAPAIAGPTPRPAPRRTPARPPAEPAGPSAGYRACARTGRFVVALSVGGRALRAGVTRDEAAARAAGALLLRAREPGSDPAALLAAAQALVRATQAGPARPLPAMADSGRRGGRQPTAATRELEAYAAAWSGARTASGSPRAQHPGVVWRPGAGWTVKVLVDGRLEHASRHGVDLAAAVAAAAAARAGLPAVGRRRAAPLAEPRA